MKARVCAANAVTEVHIDSPKTGMRSRSTGNNGAGSRHCRRR